MKFFRVIFSKNIYSLPYFFVEVIVVALLLLSTIFPPKTAEASFFSFISGNDVSAKTKDAEDAPNSQTMTVLKAVVNSNPAPLALNDHIILASENALVAEIGPAGTVSEVDDTQSSGTVSLYVVREGDTISSIASIFKVSVSTIIWANDLNRGQALKKGQTLVILPITGVRYTVKKNDTLKGIVSKHKADFDEVLRYNDLSINGTLQEGKVIIIPDGEVAVVTRPTSGSVSLPSLQDYYMRPIVGGRKSQGLHGHNGVDLAAPVGTPIVAAADGTIIVSIQNNGWNGGYGNYVVISHPNGTQSLYAHTLVNTVVVGEKVKKGDMVGKIGLTGKTTGPHLHFEIRGARNPF